MTTNQKTIKKTVRVTIVKELEIELMPSMFGGMTEEEYLAEFRKGLWNVESMDDIVKFAGRMAACYGAGHDHDGIGLVGYEHTIHPRVPDVKFREIDEEIEEEILK